MDATNRQPGDAEAAAAAAGLRETYGHTFAIGDMVSGVSGGKSWSGRITEIDGERLTIEGDGWWIAVQASDVRF
ncbi:MAG: hypothetical protein EBR23_04090 [Planctomycetia bacterium]|nr:hypothetical protein [Planctomycetia bacterium]